MNDFFVTITNKDLDNTFNNEVSNWQTMLPSQLYLVDYEVGLAQISYPFSWFNLFENQNITIVYKNDSSITNDTIIISKGYYTIEQLINIINIMIKIFADDKNIPDVTLIYLRDFDGIDKIMISFGYQDGKIIHLKLTKLLCDIFGINQIALDQFYQNILEGSNRLSFVATHTYDITVGYHSLYLYSDIIEPIMVGNNIVPLLKIIDLPSNINYNQQITMNYLNIDYRKVIQNTLKTIEIQIADDSGENIRFNENSFILLVLHFRKIIKVNN